MSDTDDIAQIANIRVHNRMRNNSISFENAKLEWGKFYLGDESHEIPASDIDKIVVSPGSMEIAQSCGRKSTSTGVEGTMDLYDGKTKICSLYWESPYFSTSNSFKTTGYDPVSSPYAMTVEPWNHGPGALGDVNITIALMAT
ncbi:hypothetical protein TrVFT333_007673 [Trichoderma virens FT-333]|nr:hypothetical protein TrVFT333_007673 [Trichoderma virens FT-333]